MSSQYSSRNSLLFLITSDHKNQMTLARVAAMFNLILI